MCIYIYIYIERERDRERERDMNRNLRPQHHKFSKQPGVSNTSSITHIIAFV